jgi:hypothetical protein
MKMDATSTPATAVLRSLILTSALGVNSHGPEARRKLRGAGLWAGDGRMGYFATSALRPKIVR